MTAVPLLDSHKGCHCRKPVSSPVASFFRRAIAAVRRRLPVPAARPAGTGTTLLASPRPYDEHICFAPGVHGKTDPYYCTLPAHWDPAARLGTPVLRDRMLSEVRAEYGPASTAELAALRDPGPPDGVPVRRVRFRRPDGEIVIDERHHVHVRPVNGRYLGTQPRRQPVYGERCQLDVERDMALAAGERARGRYQPATPALLRQVLGGLRNLDVTG